MGKKENKNARYDKYTKEGGAKEFKDYRPISLEGYAQFDK